MLERQWKTIEGVEVKDVEKYIKEALENSEDKAIHIGSDSQQTQKFTEFVTVVVILNKGKGGRAIYTRERTPRIKSLRERLLKEVWMSVTTGLAIQGHISESVEMSVHIDANPNIKFKSSSYVKELTAMVVSQGFEAILKPEAWCASHAADHVVKNKVIGR
jgi:predicted RNase H-related nuclease YkuK (DUF458 family)